MGRGSSLTYLDNFEMSERRSCGPGNYKDKNLMSRTQWRRLQRKKKAQKEATKSNNNNKPYRSQVKEQVRKPIGRQLFSPKTSQSKEKAKGRRRKRYHRRRTS